MDLNDSVINASKKWNEAVRQSAARIYNPPAPVSNEIREQALLESASQEEKLNKFHDAIHNAPFFLCSTHGTYNLNETPTTCRVPDNTWVLEAQTIGDTIITDIDKNLWTLLQGPYRYALFKYLINDAVPYDDGTLIEDGFKSVISNFIVYNPGDYIYKRNFTIGGGRSNRTGDYGNMGFYRLDPNAPIYPYQKYNKKYPYVILDNLRTQLITSDMNKITNCSLIDYIRLNYTETPKFSDLKYKRRNKTTFIKGNTITQDFRLAWPKYSSPNDPAIFIFSSCAGVTKITDNVRVERWENIAKLQAKQVLNGWSMGLLGTGGADIHITKSLEEIEKTILPVLDTKTHSKNKDDEFDPDANPYRIPDSYLTNVIYTGFNKNSKNNSKMNGGTRNSKKKNVRNKSRRYNK